MKRPGPDEIAEIARRLYAAEQKREPIRQLSLEYPDMTIEDAYAVQRALVDLKVSDGRAVKGRKIGLTSKVMQRAASIDEPDYGALFDDMFIDNGGRVAPGHFIRPRIEVELAFVLGDTLRGPGVTLFDVLRATEFVTQRWRSSMRGCRCRTLTPVTYARSSTRSPTTLPTRVWCWVGGCSGRSTSTCGGWQLCCCATARLRSLGWRRRCLTIQATA
ncbi:putative 2-oxo-hepta-3-ene-1,7-dioic acid hydratase [Mycobacterium xenopi 3993]|nr:putative 2-oxo-hepta-3-ene-1,7-dioic acid hydratase [Mycobacterium xenopi 3993]